MGRQLRGEVKLTSKTVHAQAQRAVSAHHDTARMQGEHCSKERLHCDSNPYPVPDAAIDKIIQPKHHQRRQRSRQPRAIPKNSAAIRRAINNPSGVST